jgi:NTP pyrophosphatase (non-canonical NTP hydrolase)
MHAAEYQRLTATTAVYPDRGEVGGLVYTVLGLSGEAGEIANKVKKVLRDDHGIINGKRADLLDELGDVMWYVSQVATELGSSLDDVLEANIAKLQGRKERGTLKGSGDDR